MSVDLPVLGTPTTIARKCSLSPRFLCFSSVGEQTDLTAPSNLFLVDESVPSVASAVFPFTPSARTHAAATSCGTVSALFNT